MDTECDVCGSIYEADQLTLATTTYVKAGDQLKQTQKLYCDFCLYQVPDFVKVYGDGENVDPDPDEGTEEDITGEDGGTTDDEEE